jgi:transcriptional regulator with XRE-family HTH domain
VPASKDQINLALGREIKAAYVREGMTAEQLASKAGFSVGTMTRLLGGSDIPVSRLYLIADAIGVSPVSLVEAAVARAEQDAKSEK